MTKLTLTLLALVTFTLGSALAGDCSGCDSGKGKKDKKGDSTSEGMTAEVVNI
ncbi:MAG: hypothetical protein ACK5LK_02815 [Chthoniobacterales bacterium]